MGVRTEKILKSLPPGPETDKVKADIIGIDFSDIFDKLDLGVYGKKMAIVIIDLIQANILPKIQERNQYLGLLVAAGLDAFEAYCKK